MTGWPDGTIAPRTHSEMEAAVRADFGVKLISDYLAVGSGSDESSLIQNAVNAAIVTGKRLLLKRDKTYVGGTVVTVNGPLRIEGNGATLKKTTSLNDYMMKVTGADVEVVDLNIDGNRVGGNSTTSGCLRWEGTGGKARRVTARNGRLVGLFVITGDLDAQDCDFSDIEGVTNTGDGVQVGAGGTFRGRNCRANNCRRAGYNLVPAAANGCELENCTANNNVFAGAMLQSSAGKVNGFKTRNNGIYGIYMQQASDWIMDGLDDEDAGKALNGEYTPNQSATSLEILGSNNIRIGTATSRRAYGYGYAMGAIGGVGCTYITFGDVYCQGAGDPAFFIGGSSQWITVENLTAVGVTVAISFAEETVGDNNDYNTFKNVTAIGIGYALINGVKGSHNSFGHVRAIDCWQRPAYTSLVRWVGGAATQYNVITWLEIVNTGSPPPGATMPSYIMQCGLGALHNWIAGGFQRNAIPLLNDANAAGSNRVDFATPP